MQVVGRFVYHSRSDWAVSGVRIKGDMGDVADLASIKIENTRQRLLCVPCADGTTLKDNPTEDGGIVNSVEKKLLEPYRTMT